MSSSCFGCYKFFRHWISDRDIKINIREKTPFLQRYQVKMYLLWNGLLCTLVQLICLFVLVKFYVNRKENSLMKIVLFQLDFSRFYLRWSLWNQIGMHEKSAGDVCNIFLGNFRFEESGIHPLPQNYLSQKHSD